MKRSIKTGLKLICMLMLFAGSVKAYAFTLEQVSTRYEAGEYRLALTATLAAPLQQVEAVLRDYARYPELDARILEARIVRVTAPGQLQLFTRIHVCVSILCRNVERTEQVEEHAGELLATIIADRSDAERGATHTVLSADGVLTRVHYTTYIVPKFWVPALFGRSLMLRTLRDGTLALFQHVEQRASTLPSTGSLDTVAEPSPKQTEPNDHQSDSAVTTR